MRSSKFYSNSLIFLLSVSLVTGIPIESGRYDRHDQTLASSTEGVQAKTKENILEYIFGGSERTGDGRIENNVNVNIGYPFLAPSIQTGGIAGSKPPVLPADKSEDLIHKFLGGTDSGARQDLMVGSSGQEYSAGYVQLLKQIGKDDKLTYEMKKKLFNTALSLATAPGMVSHQHILLLFTGIQDHIQFSGGGPTMADILKSLHKNLDQSEIPPQYQIDFPTDTNGEMF